MYNTVAKIRGVQFFGVGDQQIVFTCDQIGGLYASVNKLDSAQLIQQVGEPVMTQGEMVKKMKKEYANEENNIAQVNFE